MVILIKLITLFLLLLTVLIAFGLAAGKKRNGNKNGEDSYKPFVSIVIPARNEARNLLALLESFEKQTYRNFELILIDDRSEDGSLELMRSFAKNTNLNVRVIGNTEDPGSVNPKVRVLIKGLNEASGSLYLFTDADCVAGPRWVELLVGAFADERTGIVCGLLTLTGEDNMLCRFQNFDHLYRMLYAFGAIGLNAPVGCFGNNLAVRKEAYEETGGYEMFLHSATEDAELLSRVKNGGHYRVKALFDRDSFIETIHKKSWAEHAVQASRWAAGAVFSTNFLARAGFTALMLVTAFTLAMIIPGIFINTYFLCFPAVMYSFLLLSSIVFGLAGSVNRQYWKGLPVSVFLYPFVYVISFFRTVITRTINWKGTIISWKKDKGELN